MQTDCIAYMYFISYVCIAYGASILSTVDCVPAPSNVCIEWNSDLVRFSQIDKR